MANYRQIHVKIWKDNYFLDLNPEEKLLFIYLFSNDLTNLSGIYQLPLKVICFETDLSGEFVTNALKKFQDDRKIEYENGFLWVKKLRKYHETSSPKVQTHIKNDVENIPDIPLKHRYIAYYSQDIPYPYSIDTPLLKEEEEDKEQKQKEKQHQEQPPDDDIGDAFSFYESEIGALTPMISEEIGSLVDDFGKDKFIKACTIASENNARKMPYIAKVLQNWKQHGMKWKPGKDEPVKSGKDYTDGKYSEYVKH